MAPTEFVRSIQTQIRTIEGPQLVQNTDIVDDNEAIFHFERGTALVTVDNSGLVHAFTNFGPKMIWRTEPRPMDLASARLIAEFFVARAGAVD